MHTTGDYSRAEDRANVISAAVPLLAMIVFFPFLLDAAQERENVPGSLVFGFSTLLMYLTSTVYHALPISPIRTLARVFDHSAIFILIAGTYTPFTLGPLHDHQGITLLIGEWILAIVGILFKISGGMRYRRVSTGIYVAMGWLGIFWLHAFVSQVGWTGFGWLLAGGVFYTVGLVFYNAKGKPYTHLIWHIFVFAGTVCHSYAVWRYA
jgi:hemolysin III